MPSSRLLSSRCAPVCLLLLSLFLATGCGSSEASPEARPEALPPDMRPAPLRFEAVLIEDEAQLWWARVPGDVNGDGLTDVIVQNNNGAGGWLGWYEAADSGRAWTRHLIAERTPNDSLFAAGDLDAGDFDGDGDLDVLGVEHAGEWENADAPARLFWYENGGGASPGWTPHAIGTVPDAVKDVSAADLNADGRLDLAVMTFEESTLSVFRQDSSGAWTKAQALTVENLHEGMDACDLDGDADLDLAANGYWMENPGADLTGTWTVRTIDDRWHTQTGDWSRNATKVFCRDITGDDRPEVFMAHSERRGYPVVWYEAADPKAAEAWTPHVITDSLAAAHTLQVFDMDGDGDQDVVTGVNKNRAINLGIEDAWPVVVYLNGGDNETWTPHVINEDGIYNGQVADLEGDGDYDLFRLPTHEAERFEVLVNQLVR